METDHDDGAIVKVPPEIQKTSRRSLETWAAVVQAVATVLAVLIAAPSIWFVFDTLREQ
jgi:hypothetical protein